MSDGEAGVQALNITEGVILAASLILGIPTLMGITFLIWRYIHRRYRRGRRQEARDAEDHQQPPPPPAYRHGMELTRMERSEERAYSSASPSPELPPVIFSSRASTFVAPQPIRPLPAAHILEERAIVFRLNPQQTIVEGALGRGEVPSSQWMQDSNDELHFGYAVDRV
ncbi:uncharacterized protein GGS25DRAFT_467339 [Hypoxylon fragiforme]|uniref:uncharacterized protein n=1 Tax=Hypoxylon fragiforme TaxID=63214 RepID=UPI0020C5D96C|nr:uncharacterized protein GGS25DRAFT_467339 [Hypoxylon fragiforme]KAI2613483.1 hypothetical protein GGS25DRAFT_467339 [Hypoxylon fragiforme]